MRYHRLLKDEPYHREEWGHILTFQNEVEVKERIKLIILN